MNRGYQRNSSAMSTSTNESMNHPTPMRRDGGFRAPPNVRTTPKISQAPSNAGTSGSSCVTTANINKKLGYFTNFHPSKYFRH